jgi:ELWxxDGT repeat protein
MLATTPQLVADINPGPKDSEPGGFAELHGEIFFSAAVQSNNFGSANQELWKTDGTASGTVLLKEIRGGPDGSHPGLFMNVNANISPSNLRPS